jgi:hypothetical protein
VAKAARGDPVAREDEDPSPPGRQEVPTVIAKEWLATWGTQEWTGAPPAQAEADLHELGRRVAQHYCYQSVLTDDPALYA